MTRIFIMHLLILSIRVSQYERGNSHSKLENVWLLHLNSALSESTTEVFEGLYYPSTLLTLPTTIR